MQPTPQLDSGGMFVIALMILSALGFMMMAVYKIAIWLAERREARYVEWDGGSEDADIGSRTGFDDLVLRQQNQAEPELVCDFATAKTYLSGHNLSDDEAVELLAILRRDNDYLISANKIRDIIGGSDAVIKAQVARHRPRPPAKRPQRLERPANGW